MTSDPLETLDPAWIREDSHLARQWDFPDFATALAFVVAIGAEAEAQNHHPDIELGWGRVTVRITTHDTGTLTEADYALARAIDMLKMP